MSKCGDGLSCNYDSWFCNGRFECNDESDEDQEFCSNRKLFIHYLCIQQ